MITKAHIILVSACIGLLAGCNVEKTIGSDASPQAAVPVVSVMPVALPVAPAQRGFGPAPLRPHFSPFYNNCNVRTWTAPPFFPSVPPAYQHDVVTLTDAAMNGTAGAHNITAPVALLPVQQAPVQPIIIEPYINW